MPKWVDYAMWWQVYPLGFLGAEREALPADAPIEHRLPGLLPWLDYIQSLGTSGLLLGPIFASESHGYDTVDYFQIDRRLGDTADFEELTAQAHQRGIRVLLDGVFNHVGRGFPQFQQVLRDGPAAATASWFHLYWPESAGAGTGDAPVEPDYEHFEGHRQLVTLRHASDEVVDLVAEVMCHWLERGADGWRLDAAYAVPAEFWARVLPQVRARFPEAYFIGEVIHGDYPAYVRDAGLDAVTQYELWKSIWSSLNDRNLHELNWTLTRHNALLETFEPLTFVGNHDVTRIASKLTDVRHLPHAVAVLLTVGGTPSIYAGDEQGYRGVKQDRIGGDDEVRPPFPADPSELSPIGRPTLEMHRTLIGLRRRHPWLHGATTTTEHVANGQLVYTARAEGQSLVVALNLDDQHATVPVPQATIVLAGGAHLTGSGAGAKAILPAHGWAVFAT